MQLVLYSAYEPVFVLLIKKKTFPVVLLLSVEALSYNVGVSSSGFLIDPLLDLPFFPLYKC